MTTLPESSSSNFPKERLSTERLSHFLKITQLLTGSAGFDPRETGSRICTLDCELFCLRKLKTRLICPESLQLF